MNPSTPSIHAAQVLPARAVLFLGIIGLHVVFAYLFASGMIIKVTQWVAPPVILIPDPAPPKPREPPPQARPAIFEAVVPRDPDLPTLNLPTDNTAITQGVADPGPVTPLVEVPAAPPPPITLLGRNVMPNTADYYPPMDIRDGNEGTAEIQSCVNVNGKLDGTPTVRATSGRASLDKAAVRLASDGKYARAMRGDTPVPNCYRFRVTFTLHSR
jgi:TonB family protein